MRDDVNECETVNRHMQKSFSCTDEPSPISAFFTE